MEHGLTPGDGTPNEVLHGWNGQRLSAKGKSELTIPADHLLATDNNIGETYSSDLPRAVETAETMRKLLGVTHPNTERRGLRPMDVGVYAGQPKADVEVALKDLKSRRWAVAPGGESYGKFLGRFGQELHRTIQEALGEDYQCLYVTHSHNLGALEHLLSNGKKPAQLNSPVGGGGVLALKVQDSGRKLTLSKLYDGDTAGE